MKNLRSSILLAGLSLGIGMPSHGDNQNWPQYLGHQRTAQSPASIGDWQATSPKEQWAVDLGPGFGGASISDGTVYVLDRVESEADVFRALSLREGKEIWRHQYPAPGRLSHNGSRSVPTIANGKAWTVGGFGQLTCYDLRAKKMLWQVDLNKAFSTAQLKWGYAQSPLLVGDRIIVAPPHPDSPRLAAFHAATGKQAWTNGKDGGDFYVSPALRTISGITGILQLTNSKVSFHDPKDGTELWNWTGWKCTWPIPSPTVMSDQKHIMVTGGYGAGSVMLSCEKNGSKWQIQEKFRLKEGCQIHPFIELNGYLYGNINENATLKKKTKKLGGLACVDPKAGKVLWRTGDKPNFGRGAVLLAKDGLLIMDGNIGTLTAVKPSPKSYIPMGSVKAFPHTSGDHKIWAPIALIDHAVVVRDQEQLKTFRLPTR